MANRKAFFLSFLLTLFLFSISTNAGATEKLGDILLLPIVPGPNVSVDETMRIDDILSKRMKKVRHFDIYTIEDFKEKYGHQTARRVMRCGDEFKCLDKRLIRAKYNILIVGKATLAGGEKLDFRFTIYNMEEGLVKRARKFSAKNEEFKDNPHARKWAMALLRSPRELLALEELEDDLPAKETSSDDWEQDGGSKAQSRGASRRQPAVVKQKFLTKEEVLNGIQSAYESFCEGNLDKATQTVAEITKKRCACDADARAFAFKAMLEGFKTAKEKVDTAFKRVDAKQIINNLEEMNTYETELTNAGKRLGSKKTSIYASQFPHQYAEAYTIKGKSLMKSAEYLEAREYFKKALEFQADYKEAKEQIERMPTKVASALYMQGANMAMYDPRMAKKKLKMALELAEEGSKLAEKIAKKLDEIEAIE